MNAPKMSHTVELLYPDSAQVRAALAERKPGSDNCCGLNSAKRPSTATTVMPIRAMAAPGNGSRIRPTITPTKIEKKYHACGARPEGTGSNASTIAIAPRIVEEFVDIETAKTSGRSAFGQMVKFLQKNPSVKHILVEKTDRLYRNFKDYVLID